MREHVRTTIPAYDSDHPFFFTVFDDSHQFHLWIVSKNFTLIVTRYQVCTYECISIVVNNLGSMQKKAPMLIQFNVLQYAEVLS